MRYRTDTLEINVHAGLGADGNDGSAGAPVATTLEALDRIPPMPWGQRVAVRYLPGHVETIDKLVFPPILGAGPVDAVATDGGDPAWDYLRPQIRLVAAPGVVDTVNGTLDVLEPTSGILLVTDASKAWTPGEHVGHLIIDPGRGGELGVIFGNTTTALWIAMVSGNLSSADPLQILGRSARLTATRGIQIQAVTAALAFVGLELTSTVGPALDVLNPGLVQLLGCQVTGGIQTRDGAARLEVDACRLKGGFLALNAGRVAIRQCHMDGMRTAFHGVAGQYDVYGCVVDDCEPLGHAGTSTPQGGFRIDNTWIRRSRGHGVVGYGGNRSRVTRTRIDDAHGSAIYLDGPGATLLDGVTGTGSSDYGCTIVNGATANVRGAITVQGLGRPDAHGQNDGGEVLLGTTPHRWTDAPTSSSDGRLA